MRITLKVDGLLFDCVELLLHTLNGPPLGRGVQWMSVMDVSKGAMWHAAKLLMRHLQSLA